MYFSYEYKGLYRFLISYALTIDPTLIRAPKLIPLANAEIGIANIYLVLKAVVHPISVPNAAPILKPFLNPFLA